MSANPIVRAFLRDLAFCFASSSPEEAPSIFNPPKGSWLAPVAPPGIREFRNLVFRRTPQRPLLLDLFLPAEEPLRPFPLIIWVHGGGWMYGDKEFCPPLPFVARGFAVASLSYRYSTEAIYPAQIEDCKAATRWLRAHADQYELDPNRFGVWGHSAGGHLCALIGTTGTLAILDGENPDHAEQSSAVQAVCDFSGPTDMTHRARSGASQPTGDVIDLIANLVGGPPAERPELLSLANPVRFVTGDAPPFYIVHGAQDPLVSADQNRLLHEALLANGVDSVLEILEDEGHEIFYADTEKVVRFFEQKLAHKD